MVRSPPVKVLRILYIEISDLTKETYTSRTPHPDRRDCQPEGRGRGGQHLVPRFGYTECIEETERAALRFRRKRSLQKFAAVHASVSNHFNQERRLSCRNIFKANGAAHASSARKAHRISHRTASP
jgi:hypothetical protein